MNKLISVNEMSLNFNLREPRGNKSTNVYIVVKCGANQLKISTGLKVNSWQWNKKLQAPIISNKMTNDDRENNTKLMSLISAVRFGYSNYFSYLCAHQQMTNENEIKESINNILKELNNNDMANNENLQKGKSVKATTLLKKAYNIYYTEIKTKVKESAKKTALIQLSAFFKYCEEIGKDGKSMLTQKGLNEYKSYLIKKAKESKENGSKRYDSNLQINNKCQAVARYINEVMVSHNDFIKYSIERVNYVTLEKVNAKGEDKKRRPLTSEEMTKLMTCNSLAPKEKEYRDLFVLECNCAYRIGDTQKLFDKSAQKHYKKGDYELIMINTQKENIDAVILVTPIVREILERYEKGFKFADPTDKLYRNTFNRVIKKIAKKCGLDAMETYIDAHGEKQTQPLYEIISSHFGRYTFINNALKIGFSPNELKDFTGHANDQMINDVYSIVTKDDKAENAFRALERLSLINNTNADKKGSDDEKIKEYKDVLAFYGEPHKNYKFINDSEELLRMIISKYEMPLKEKGYSTKLLKKIYNSNDMETKEQYNKLLKILNEISETISKE